MTTTHMWKIQRYGLFILVFLCFFPRLHRVHEYLFFALFLTAAATAWIERRSLRIRTAIDAPLLALLAWILLSIPFATDSSYSFQEWRKLGAGALAFYWSTMVIRAQPDRAGQKSVLTALLLGSAVLSAYAVGEFIERGGSWRDRTIRAGAPSSDFNWLSTYIVLTFPLLVAIAFVVRSWKVRSAVIGVCALESLAQVLSYTRAGWLAMVIEAVLFGGFLRRRTMWVTAGAVVGLATIGLVALVVVGLQVETTSTNTFYYRLASWKLMLQEIVAHPLVGIGYGNGTFMFKFAGTIEAHNAGGAHNLFLMVAMGSGLPALAFLVWVFVRSVKTLLSAARSADSCRATFLVGSAIAVVGFLVRNLFDHMLIGALGYLFWIVLASGLASAHEGDPSKRDVSPTGEGGLLRGAG